MRGEIENSEELGEEVNFVARAEIDSFWGFHMLNEQCQYDGITWFSCFLNLIKDQLKICVGGEYFIWIRHQLFILM